jgi:hypothetical protein
LKTAIIRISDKGQIEGALKENKLVAIPLPGEEPLSLKYLHSLIRDTQRKNNELSRKMNDTQRNNNKLSRKMREMEGQMREMAGQLKHEIASRDEWQLKAEPLLGLHAILLAQQVMKDHSQAAIMTQFSASEYFLKRSHHLKTFSQIYEEVKELRMKDRGEDEEFFLTCFSEFVKEYGPGVKCIAAIRQLHMERNAHAHHSSRDFGRRSVSGAIEKYLKMSKDPDNELKNTILKLLEKFGLDI